MGFVIILPFSAFAADLEVDFLLPQDTQKTIITIEDMNKSAETTDKTPVAKEREDKKNTSQTGRDEENKKEDLSGWEQENMSCD